MALLRKYYKANSLIESVIALTIISICLFIAILVYSHVFSPKTSTQHYNKQNILNQQFYELQLNDENVNSETISMEENWLNTNLREVSVQVKDSVESDLKAKFYLYSNE